MIVADVNLIAYFFIEGERTRAAEAVIERDPEWAAPLLWRSEWRNVLAGYLRRGELDASAAMELIEAAEALLRGREHLPDAGLVMELVLASSCSAYDCEYVALAEALGLPLVTADARLLADFPERAISPEAFTG
ncbi:MAG: type II toxin-antitoxin system VapC family toxin [Gemmatimonadota bacterium]